MLPCLFAFVTLVAQPSSWCHYCVAILYCLLSQTHYQASWCLVTVLPLLLLHIVTLLSHCCWHCHISRCFPLKLAPLLRCYYPLCVFSYKHCQTLSHYCYIVSLLPHYIVTLLHCCHIIALLPSVVCLLLQTQSTFPNFVPPGRSVAFSQKSVELFRASGKELQDGWWWRRGWWDQWDGRMRWNLTFEFDLE